MMIFSSFSLFLILLSAGDHGVFAWAAHGGGRSALTASASASAPACAACMSSSSSNSLSISRRDLVGGLGGALVVPATTAASAAFAAAGPAATAQVTNKCYIDLRIVEPLTEENGYSSRNSPRVRVSFGLYGNDAPKTVRQFLTYISEPFGSGNPSYSSSLVYRKTPGTSLVELGKIKGLNKIAVAGSQQLEYGGRVIPYQPALEMNSLKHDSRGLLTKRKLEGGSEFGITLNRAPELDGEWTVFGRILEGDFILKALESLPVLTGGSNQAEGSDLDNIYKAQRSLALGFGKAIGDERARDRSGTFLRRVDAVACGLL